MIYFNVLLPWCKRTKKSRLHKISPKIYGPSPPGVSIISSALIFVCELTRAKHPWKLPVTTTTLIAVVKQFSIVSCDVPWFVWRNFMRPIHQSPSTRTRSPIPVKLSLILETLSLCVDFEHLVILVVKISGFVSASSAFASNSALSAVSAS